MNFVPDHLLNFYDNDTQWLLAHYDNPKNFQIPDHREEVSTLGPKSFPKHATVLLTHGLFGIEWSDRKLVVQQIENTKQKAHNILTPKKQAYRLLRNFSDWWTRKVMKYSGIPSQNILIPKSPRIAWDPARAVNDKTFIRDTDFNGNKLMPTVQSSHEKTTWAKNHAEYHEWITSHLSHIETTHWWSITFDIHDTGVNMMGINPKQDTFREWWYPKMEIGTLDGASCDPEILSYFVEQVEKYFGFTPVVNEKYKWGYVTKKHGWEARESLEKAWEKPNKRNVLQIELGRYLYMKESTQEIDHEQARKVWAALRMCIQKTCEKFGEEYFANLD